MSFFKKMFSTGLVGFDKEEMKAKKLWHTYAKSSLAYCQKYLEGRRISIEYQSRYAGTNQAATILQVGLQDLGAEIVGAEDDFDIKIGIKRGSSAEGVCILTDGNGDEVDRATVHHELLVPAAVETLAKYFKKSSVVVYALSLSSHSSLTKQNQATPKSGTADLR